MRRALPVALSVALLALACGDASTRAADLRADLAGTSVLVVAYDALAVAHTTPGGHARDTTPYLARLAARGVRFADASASTSSGAASLVSLLTGETVDVHGVTGPDRRLAADLPAPAEAFGAAGYRTLFASSHPAVADDVGWTRGFEEVLRPEGAGTELAVDAVEHLLAAGDARPFLAVVHLTRLAPPRALEPEVARVLLGYVPDPRAASSEALREADATRRADPETVLALVDAYDAALRAADAELERALERLLRSARGDDTLVCVLGLTGQAFGQHGNFGAGTDVHQEQVAVPLVVRFPDERLAGRVLDAPVGTHELLPTLLDLFGVPAGSRTATPWTPLFCGDWLQREVPLVLRTTRARPSFAVRRDHFKLIVKPSSKALYHLDKDPLEAAAGSTQRPELLRELDRDLEAYRRRFPPALGERVELPAERRAALAAMGYAAFEPGSE